MKASLDWLAASSAAYQAGEGITGFAHLSRYAVRYADWGAGPPLVLVPGLAGGYELLGPLARLLANHFRVISYQLRGEDDPFALRQRFGLPELADDLAEFIGWMGLECPAVMGVSFGGMIALELAARHPSSLQKLVVQGVGSRFERGYLQHLAGAILSCFPLPADSPFVNQFFNLLFGGRNRPGSLFDFVTRQCWQTDQSVMAHRFHLAERFDMAGRLHRVRVPSLILSGERDLLVSADSLKELHDGLSGSRLIELEGCGHLAFAMQPKHIASEVRGFLQG